ncbi:MAG: hypothetical protein ACLQBY_10145 [Solirubrobacteraceae bacterium]
MLVEPRYSKQMPWVLVAAGIVVAILALVVRTELHANSIVLVQVPAKSESNATSSDTAAPEKLAVEKKTTTDQPTSDSTFSTLFGIAAVLLLLGAFYTRISKITVAGNSLELLPSAPNISQDNKAVANVVVEKLGQQAREEGTITPEQAVKLVEVGTAVAARVQSQTAGLRLAASAIPAAAHSRAVSISTDELRALSSGQPVPDDLLKRLADQALKDVAKGD